MVGTAYTDAEFSHAWHQGGQEKEKEMCESWASMWAQKKERGGRN